METSGVSADQVAEEIAKAVRDNTFMLLTHGQTRWAWRMKRWLPQRYFKMLVKRSPGKNKYSVLVSQSQWINRVICTRVIILLHFRLQPCQFPLPIFRLRMCAQKLWCAGL